MLFCVHQVSVYFSGQIMSADKYTSIIFGPAEDYSASSKTSRIPCLGMPLFSFFKHREVFLAVWDTCLPLYRAVISSRQPAIITGYSDENRRLLHLRNDAESLGCVPLGGSGSGFLICGIPLEQILFQVSDLSNPLWTRIHRNTDRSDLQSDHQINDPARSFWWRIWN